MNKSIKSSSEKAFSLSSLRAFEEWAEYIPRCIRKLKAFFNLDSLSVKVNLSLLTVALVPLLITMMITVYILDKGLLQIEQKNIQSRMDQALLFLQKRQDLLLSQVNDYAYWDEMYEMVKERNMDWISANVIDWVPKELGMDLVLITDRSEREIVQYGCNLDDFAPYSGMLNKVMQGNKIKGFVELGGNLYEIAAAPIFPYTYKAQQGGMVLFGRLLSEQTIKEIRQDTGLDINISTSQSPAQSKLLVTDKYISYSLPIHDLQKKPIGYVNVTSSRKMFSIVLSYMKKNIFITILSSGVIVIVLAFLLKQNITKPIVQIRDQLEKMEADRTLSKLNITGGAEIQVIKDSFNHLVDSLKKERLINEVLHEQSITDSLTGLYNHRYFYDYLEKNLRHSVGKTALIYIDIDFFKLFNDMHGHLAGDNVLREISKIIKEHLGPRDKAFRYGGEELAVIMPDTSLSAAESTAEKIRLAVESAAEIQRLAWRTPLTVSIGVAIYPDNALNALSLVDCADKALYYAKHNGRNQIQIYRHVLNNIAPEEKDEREKEDLLLNSVHALVSAVDARDRYTGSHSEAVSYYATSIAENLGLPPYECYMLRIAGLLHDCGKIGISDTILQKPGPLSDEERALIMTHPITGGNILRYLKNLETIIPCVVHHHERYDGKGYPDGLAAENIPLWARILSIADAFHAMTSERPYRSALKTEQAIEELLRHKGTQFDPNLVDIFVNLIKSGQLSPRLK